MNSHEEEPWLQALRNMALEDQREGPGSLEDLLLRRRRRVRGRNLRMAVVAAAVSSCIGLGYLGGRIVPSAPKGGAAAGLVILADGSQVVALDRHSRVKVEQQDSRSVRVVLEDGASLFKVAKLPERGFWVDVGAISVETVGTVFSVSKLDEDHASVSVFEGRVRVHAQNGPTVLDAGGTQRFSLAGRQLGENAVKTSSDEDANGTAGDGTKAREPELDASNADTPRSPAKSESFPDSGPRADAAMGWKGLATQRRFDAAWAALAERPTIADLPGDLLLAADVARFSGHPKEAIGFLKQLLSNHPGDARVPVAALTLGRVQMQAGQPDEAAESFRRARAGGGALQSDALAAEADARRVAGQAGQAKQLAARYLSEYPEGVHAERFRQMLER